MAPSRRSIDNILTRVNFPLYTIDMLTSRHIIVGGGGGSSKTGVANGFEIFELSHDGTKFIADPTTRHDTGPSVVMSCAAYSDTKRLFLVAGQESHCQLYNVDSVVEEENIETIDNEVKQRKPTVKQKTNNGKRLRFVVRPSDCVQTDFKGQDPLLRIVRVHPTGKLMATGGTDGQVRLWKFPTLQPCSVLKAHRKEIDDIDFSLHDNYMVTIAKDGLCILWDCVKAKEIRRLTWQQPEGSKYLYKRCRFGVVEGDDRKRSALYTLTNPMAGMARNQKSFLQRWLLPDNDDGGALTKSIAFDESLSALAVRDDGRFVAVGTMLTGSVSIHVAFSLQKVINVVGAHPVFVTGLKFLPVLGDDLHAITSAAEAAVLSISVDSICIHTVPYRRTMPAFVGILILIFTLFLTFVFCSYIGL